MTIWMMRASREAARGCESDCGGRCWRLDTFDATDPHHRPLTPVAQSYLDEVAARCVLRQERWATLMAHIERWLEEDAAASHRDTMTLLQDDFHP